MFKNTLDNKRYHTLNYYYKNKYGKKVVKIPVNAGCTCPNKINGGCIFCSGDFEINRSNKSILEQFNQNKTIFEKKWPYSLYVIYFQNNTNTYGDFNRLTTLFNEAIKIPNVIGLTIATRPDCITEEWINYFKEINNQTELIIELGLQSMHDKTLSLINRGHDLKCFDKCVKKLKDNNIKVVVHIINGLPYETKEDMINTVKHLNSLKIDGIKIHMLYIAKNTKLEELYNKEQFHLLTKEEFIDITTTQLTYLNEDIVIHRITGDPERNSFIAPLFVLDKCQLINDIDKHMKALDLYQGLHVSK